MAEIPPAEQSVNQLVDAIHNIAAGHMPIGTQIGIVLALPPEIQVAWNNTILTKEDIYIDTFLLPNYGRMSKGDTQFQNMTGTTKMDSASGNIETKTIPRAGGSGYASYSAHVHNIDHNYNADIQGDFEANAKSDYQASVIYTDFGIQVGDKVALEPIMNGQKFILRGKLIYLPDWEPPKESQAGGNSLW